ncbi:MAG: hypothetical protein DRZ80_01580 [Thermoprotei archaeon]|nr:MAG: hypothetical protein DRZ80_01580 [Thermoprotei archaeon]
MSYSEIISVLEAELESEKLQSIEFDFYTKVRKHLHELKEKSENAGSDLEKSMYMKELLFLTFVIRKIVLLRIRKIIDILLREEFLKNEIEKYLAKEEREIMNNIISVIDELSKIERMSGKAESIKENEKKIVIFKKDYPAIVLKNGNMMGPFHSGDVVYMPSDAARELFNNNIVDIVG